MSERFQISGKKLVLPKSSGAWKFSARPGGWVIAESVSGERKRFQLTELRGRLSAALGGVIYSGQLQAEARAGGSEAGGDADLIAQFPGKVRKVLVKQGAQVLEGDPLVLVEAMKMEFAIKAPFAGCVEKLHVIEGQQLAPGDRFLDLKETAK
ncbi:MAG: acetyl-CoA carboxylase biotin carboxyl carrier protein subunit [Bdellovibrionota bacterium]